MEWVAAIGGGVLRWVFGDGGPVEDDTSQEAEEATEVVAGIE